MQINPNDRANWVENLVSAAPVGTQLGQPDGWVVLYGYLNFDIDPGNPLPNPLPSSTVFRLYLSLQLDEYLVIKADDIIWERRVPEGPTTPLGGNMLWIRSSARIEYVKVPPPFVEIRQQPGTGSSLQAQASFLRGPIAGGYGLANLTAQQGGAQGVTIAGCPGNGVSLACATGGVTLGCATGGVTLGCNTGGVTLACATGGLTLGCPGGGASLGCATGGLSLAGC